MKANAHKGKSRDGYLHIIAISALASLVSTNALRASTNTLPQISEIAAQRLAINTATQPLAFTVADMETPADLLIVTAISSNTNIVPDEGIVLGGGGADRTVTVTPGSNQPGSVIITLSVFDQDGAYNQTSFPLTVDMFTQLQTTIPALTLGAVAWGDYDNDGWLDLAVTGTTNQLASGAITRIYQNVDGTLTNYISLTNLFHSALAWSDYDCDGRLDLTVSGVNQSNEVATVLYHNNGDGTFKTVDVGFAGAQDSSLAWGDFNNDGAPDLFVCGQSIIYPPFSSRLDVSALYRNDGGGKFTLTPSIFLGVSSGSAAWGDYDNDGRLDLLAAGITNALHQRTDPVARIYQNLGDGIFTNINANIRASRFENSASWCDVDNDGWLDVLVQNGSTLMPVYRNFGNGAFSTLGTLTNTSSACVAWGDYDNDGDSDALSGGWVSHLIRNNLTNGSVTFEDSAFSLPAKSSRYGVAWADCDNDGSLDAIVVGISPGVLLMNGGVSKNTPPATPADLAVTMLGSNSVSLTWLRPADSQTHSNGLSYNLRVGTSPGGVDVMPPLANPTNGFRGVAALGNVGMTNRALLINLPKGVYYWSVQAIDTAFAGSPFAAEGMFEITNARPTISDLADQIIPPLLSVTNSFQVADLETSASNLVVTVRSSNTNVAPLADIHLAMPDSSAPGKRTVSVTSRYSGTSVITVSVMDAQGASANDNFVVDASPFTLVSTNLIRAQNGFTIWGDYDNDGRLDVLVSGDSHRRPRFSQEPPLLVSPRTVLYHNDGGGAFSEINAGFPSLLVGAGAWGDYDNDGRLDLAFTGTTNGLTNGAICRIYKNLGDGTFTDIGAALPGIYYSSVTWGDFDNDGRSDLLISGTTNEFRAAESTRIYRNLGNGAFSNVRTFPCVGGYHDASAWADLDGDGDLDVMTTYGKLQIHRNDGASGFSLAAEVQSSFGVNFPSVAVADYDNDGLPDLLLPTPIQTDVVRNLGNFNFSRTAILTGSISGVWGDFDNDGRLDISLSPGFSLSQAFSEMHFFRNTGGTNPVFTNYPTGERSVSSYLGYVPTDYSGFVNWVDYDNDGDLDMMIASYNFVQGTEFNYALPSSLFRNNTTRHNTPPTAPTLPIANVVSNVMTLSWTKSSDAQTTNSNGMKYQVRIGTTPGGFDIAAPNSDPVTGYRRIVRTGAASANRWRVNNLPPGTYYWAVQAIDTAFAGSPFSSEGTFLITQPPVVVGDAFFTATNTPVSFPAAKLALNDFDPDGGVLEVAAVSSNSAAGGIARLISGVVTYTPKTDYGGNDSFTYTVIDGQGGTAIGTVLVTVGNGGAVSLNIVSGPEIKGGNFVVRFAGIPGLTYTIERADSVAGPWTKALNVAAPEANQGFGAGVFEFSEPVGSATTRFYRTVFPSY